MKKPTTKRTYGKTKDGKLRVITTSTQEIDISLLLTNRTVIERRMAGFKKQHEENQKQFDLELETLQIQLDAVNKAIEEAKKLGISITTKNKEKK